MEGVFHSERGVGTTHKIVTFETAHRGVGLFEGMAKVYGLPNMSRPHCNRELKVNPMGSYKKSLGLKRNHLAAVGIRIDEIDRMSANATKDGLIYPLIKWSGATKDQIINWWAKQPFDLEIPEHKGNCVTCWKKSDRKLFTLAKNEPELFEPFIYLEENYAHAGAGDEKRSMFRKNRTAKDIIASSAQPFVEYTGYETDKQLSISFEVDEFDIEADCGASCEVG